MKQLILNGAARLLPAHLQTRYQEQWQADLDGAAELGMSRWSVVWGAVLSAISLSGNVELRPAEKAKTLVYRARWALTLVTGFFIFLAFAFSAGGLTLSSELQVGSPGWVQEFALATFVSILDTAGIALAISMLFALGWALSTFAPVRFHAFTMLLVGLLFTAGYALPVILPSLNSGSGILSLCGAWVCSLLLWMWGMISSSSSPKYKAHKSAQKQLKIIRVGALMVSALATVFYPIYTYLAVKNRTYPGTATLSTTHWLPCLAALLMLVFCYLVTARTRTLQGVLATFGLVGFSAAFLCESVTYHSMTWNHPSVINAAGILGSSTYAVHLIFSAAVVVGVILAIAPRVPEPAEVEQAPQIKLLKAA